MQILVHDYSGHPFQSELSVELARRGHEVVHSWCEAHVSGRGNLEQAVPGLEFESIGRGEVVDKLSFRRRLVQELRFGVQLARQTRRHRPEVLLIANVPIPMLAVITVYLWLRRIPWVLWQQDVQGVAIASFAGAKLSPAFRIVAWVIARVERWCVRRAAATVVIADAFVPVHETWGTAHKVSVIPNWAPLGELVPVGRDNAWAREHDLVDSPTILYSGTLGLKHDPALLVALTARVRRAGVPARLVVVTEGPAVELLRTAADAAGVPVDLQPFQPYGRLSEVLGSGDLLVVLLDASAGSFSVPSKTLSYLCAGRPVLGLMPSENLAAGLIEEAGGVVLAPAESALDEAAAWVAELLTDAPRRAELGHRGRALAEREFALDGAADRFEELLSVAASRKTRQLSTV